MAFSRFRGRGNQEQPPGDDRLAAALDAGADIVMILGRGGEIEYLSAGVERLLGYRPRSRSLGDILAAVHPSDAGLLSGCLDAARAAAASVRPIDVRVRRADGVWRYMEVSASNLLADERVRGLVVIWRDITERKSVEQQLEQHAFHDPLTGLPNRAIFMSRLDEALERAAAGSGVAVLFLDLDGFKVINDSLGHQTGDVVLIEAARRIARCLHPGDLLSRFGGDEFTVLVEQVTDAAVALRRAHAIAAEFRRPIPLAGREVYVGVSAGIALSSSRQEPPASQDLLREADTALYMVKSRERGGAEIFRPAMNAHMLDRLTLETDLRGALHRGEFMLMYQPAVDLTTGTVSAVEALIRWQHPQRGLVGPAHFIPLAEESGLIVPIGEWVLAEACRQAREWRSLKGGGGLVMGVNLSPRQLQLSNVGGMVQRVLQDTGLAPADVKLEITESTLVQEERAQRSTLAQLRALGVGLALDDFGTGYSSLAYLRAFSADTVKVDRSFAAGMEDAADRAAIIKGISDLAHALGMDVTIEGVETAGQLARARNLRCDSAQGYYFTPPLPAVAVSGLLASQPFTLRHVS